MAIARKSSADPLQVFRYVVSIPGLSTNIGFKSISGLEASVSVEEFEEGDDTISARKFPSIMEFEEVTLERGLVLDDKADTLLNWFDSVIDTRQLRFLKDQDNFSQVDFKKTVIIRLIRPTSTGEFGTSQDTGRIIKLEKAWPSHWELNDLDAESSDFVIQTLELTHEGIYFDRNNDNF